MERKVLLSPTKVFDLRDMPKCNFLVDISIVVLCCRQAFCGVADSLLYQFSEMCGYRKLPHKVLWTLSELQHSQWGSFSEHSLLQNPLR